MVTKVARCKKASVRKEPDKVEEKKMLETDVIGYLKEGTKVTIDVKDMIYDWTGRAYVKSTDPTPGYIYIGCLEMI